MSRWKDTRYPAKAGKTDGWNRKRNWRKYWKSHGRQSLSLFLSRWRAWSMSIWSVDSVRKQWLRWDWRHSQNSSDCLYFLRWTWRLPRSLPDEQEKKTKEEPMKRWQRQSFLRFSSARSSRLPVWVWQDGWWKSVDPHRIPMTERWFIFRLLWVGWSLILYPWWSMLHREGQETPKSRCIPTPYPASSILLEIIFWSAVILDSLNWGSAEQHWRRCLERLWGVRSV